MRGVTSISPSSNRGEMAQQLKHLPIGSGGPCTHLVANGAVMLMNAFTHEDVDASYRKCGCID